MIQQITYCSGQLLSGVLGDRLNPRRMITCGLLVGALTNMVMPLVHSTALMVVIWGCNGLALAMIWPPMVKILTNLLQIGVPAGIGAGVHRQHGGVYGDLSDRAAGNPVGQLAVCVLFFSAADGSGGSDLEPMASPVGTAGCHRSCRGGRSIGRRKGIGLEAAAGQRS